MTDSTSSISEPVIDVDVTTRARVGSLVAHGLLDHEICSALLLSPLQLDFCKTTLEYQAAYSKNVLEKAEQRHDIERGWDAVEERGIEVTLKHLLSSNDPKYALHAAMIASKAPRRQTSQSNRIIDANGGAQTIILQMNPVYINRMAQGNKTINIEQRDPESAKQIPRKQVDIPAPRRVMELLTEQSSRDLEHVDEYEEQMRSAGINFKDFAE